VKFEQNPGLLLKTSVLTIKTAFTLLRALLTERLCQTGFPTGPNGQNVGFPERFTENMFPEMAQVA
jgi:hypothetical protein